MILTRPRIRVSIDYAYQLTTRTLCLFPLNECLSLNRALAYLEWLLVLQTLRGERLKTKVTPEIKKKFLSNTNYFFCIELKTVILKNRQLREVPPFPRACHIYPRFSIEQTRECLARFARSPIIYNIRDSQLNRPESVSLASLTRQLYIYMSVVQKKI